MLTTYKEHDKVNEYGPDTMFAKLIGNAVTLSKAARKEPLDIPALDRALTNVVVWTTSIANTAYLPLLDVMAEKYLLGCPRYHNMPCNLAHDIPCERSDTLPKGGLTFRSTLDGWQEHMAKSIQITTAEIYEPA